MNIKTVKTRSLLVLIGGLLLGHGRVACAQNGVASLPAVNPRAKQSYVDVLMWHDVVASKKEVWFDTTVSELKGQLEAIRRRHCHVITLEALYKHLSEGTPVPSRPVVLTFDDNYGGLYTYAFPLLKRYGYPATFFAHTDFVGVVTVKPHCTWDQLREMEQSGLISVQSQTRTHPADIRTLTDAQLNAELSGSKAVLEKQLGRPIYALSYPEGKYDLRCAHAAARNGYKIAVMEDWGSAGDSVNLLMVHRYSIHRRFAQALRDLERAWPHS